MTMNKTFKLFGHTFNVWKHKTDDELKAQEEQDTKEVLKESVIELVKQETEPVYRTVQVSTVKSGKTSLWCTGRPVRMTDANLTAMLEGYEERGELTLLNDENWRPDGCVFAWRVPTRGQRRIKAEDSFDMIIQWD